MKFSDYEYASSLLFPLLFFAGIIVFTGILARFLTTKKCHISLIACLWIIVLVILLSGLFTYSEGFEYPLSALLQKNSTQYITVGVIENIKCASSPPIYYDSNENTWDAAQIITVDGRDFYLLRCDAEVNQVVELRWGTDKSVVYEYTTLPLEGNYKSSTYPVKPTVSDALQNENADVGQKMAIVSACVFALCVLMQYLFGKKVSSYFVEADKNVKGRIIPNRAGIFLVCLMYLPLCGIIIGLLLKGFRGVLIVILSGTICILVLMAKKQSTTVSLDGNALVIKELGKVRHIPMEAIAAAYFDASRVPFNRCLTIRLKNGVKLRFEQENFYGLDDMYERICRRQDKKGNLI